MSNTDQSTPLSDKIEGAPHPAQTIRIFGQEAAENEFLDVFAASRLHHGWLISGPRGVGKATLAWQITKFLLATPNHNQDVGLFGDPPKSSQTLQISSDHPVSRRILAGSEPGVFPLRPAYDEKRKRHKQMITIDEVRKLKSFFGLSSTEAGRRIVIVDCAEDMNPSAANALLKILEEPPKNAFLFLISHQPARLLPTIRSRCRELRLSRLNKPSMVQALEAADIHFDTSQQDALTKLSGGSIGEAVRILNMQGLPLYQSIIDIFGSLPRLDNKKVHALADKFSGRGTSPEFELFISLFEIALNRLALNGARIKAFEHIDPYGEPQVFNRLSPDHLAARKWAELAQTASQRLRHGRTVNLDPTALILDTFFKVETCSVRVLQ